MKPVSPDFIEECLLMAGLANDEASNLAYVECVITPSA